MVGEDFELLLGDSIIGETTVILVKSFFLIGVFEDSFYLGGGIFILLEASGLFIFTALKNIAF